MTIYEKIKSLRIQMRLSQDELAKMTGYTDRSSIAKIEAGKVDLTESKIISFAKAFGVSPSYLMCVTEEEAPLAPAVVLAEDETKLLTDYRSMNPEGKTAALAAVRGLAASGIYKKRDDPSRILGGGA